jgi:hypothetical protein
VNLTVYFLKKLEYKSNFTFFKTNEVRLGQFAISIIQISFIPFRLSKLRNLISTERVWQNCLFGSVLESLWNLFDSLNL